MELHFINVVKIVRSLNKSILCVRKIMTSSKRCEKAFEELQKNPYYEKYAVKIATLQQNVPEEFVSRIENNAKANIKSESGKIEERRYTSMLKPKKELQTPVEVHDQQLGKILKIELIEHKEASEIKKIWEDYHMHKDTIAATIPAEEYDIISAKARDCPMFLFPLPRSQGYEFIMSQFQKNTVHFTPLICYQVHKENAPECLTMRHYTEFKQEKGIVLMRGEFDKDVIDAKEAQCLANQLQIYYGQINSRYTELLEQFTYKPDQFKHIDLIKQIENIVIQ